MPTHSDDDLEVLAQKQELIAFSTVGLFTGSPTAEELFTRSAGYRSKRVHYQHNLYRNPWAKDDEAVRIIAASFKRQRATFNDGLKERSRLEESNSSSQADTKRRDKAKAKARIKKQPA